MVIKPCSIYYAPILSMRRFSPTNALHSSLHVTKLTQKAFETFTIGDIYCSSSSGEPPLLLSVCVSALSPYFFSAIISGTARQCAAVMPICLYASSDPFLGLTRLVSTVSALTVTHSLGLGLLCFLPVSRCLLSIELSLYV